jgi:hypothetical protein
LYGNKQILKFSAKFREEIKKLEEKGYYPAKVSIRHIVYWKSKEYAI